MSDSNAKPERCWQEITAEAAQEPTPEKLIELSDELAVALDQRKRVLRPTYKSAKRDTKKKSA
jgi:hypothetical protein